MNLLRKIFDEGKKNKEFDKKINNDTAVVFLHIIQGLRCRVLKQSKGQGIDDAVQKRITKRNEPCYRYFYKRN